MDPSSPPPWRVFDAPASPAASLDGDATSPSAGPLPAGPGALFRDGRLAIAGGLAVAAVALVLAAVFATGAIGGDVTLDALGGHPLGSTAASSPGSAHAIGQIVIDVAGAVLRPGVYRLDAGARIGDAIAAAGGYSPRVAANVVARTLNLAAVLHDGDLIVVPSRDDAVAVPPSAGPGHGGGSGGGATTLDLNQASADALDSLPGIGPVTAAKIIASRTQTPFGSVDDLLSRKLVSQKVFDQIRALVSVR